MMHNQESVLTEFTDSWKWVHEYFNDLNFYFAPKICNFIEQMQQKGYNKTLRAGVSMAELILSRSEHYGLTHDQAYLKFSPSGHGMKVTIQFDGTEEVLMYEAIELTPQIDAILKRLEAEPIS